MYHQNYALLLGIRRWANNRSRPGLRVRPRPGSVIDKTAGIPVEYANVVLYSMRDSSIVAGTVTDQDGKFKLEKVRYGRMYAIANFIGYHKKIIPEEIFSQNFRTKKIRKKKVILISQGRKK